MVRAALAFCEHPVHTEPVLWGQLHPAGCSRALEREGASYAVLGAVAVNIHGLSRATQDLDIFIAPDADNVKRLKRALRAVFADPAIEEISASDLLGDWAHADAADSPQPS